MHPLDLLALIIWQFLPIVLSQPIEINDTQTLDLTPTLNDTTSLGVTKWPKSPFIWRPSVDSEYEMQVLNIIPFTKPGVDVAEVGADIAHFAQVLGESVTTPDFTRSLSEGTFWLLEAGAQLEITVSTQLLSKPARTKDVLAALNAIADTYPYRVPASLTMILREAGAKGWRSWGSCQIRIIIKELTAGQLAESIPRNITELQVGNST